jgi:hypothetical protein
MTATAKKRARKLSARKTYVKRTYGLDWDEYQAILDSQGGVCAICGGKRTYSLNVDHDHKTGFVRGLLCRLCNGRLLPASKDRPAVLRAAAAYLEAPPAFSVIGRRAVPAGDTNAADLATVVDVQGDLT